MGLSCRVGSKLFIALFLGLVFVLGVAMTCLGIVALTQLDDTFQAVVPLWIAGLTLASGVSLVAFGLGGTIKLSTSKLGKGWICLSLLLTAAFFSTFLTATVSAFAFSDAMKRAFETGFSDAGNPNVRALYTGIRNAHLNAYVECNATSYFTNRVHTSCQVAQALGSNSLEVSQCADNSYGGGAGGNRAGMYCRNGRGLEPFTIDRVLSFPSQLDLSFAAVVRSPTYGHLLSGMCMPSANRYYDLMGELVALNIPNILLPAGVTHTVANSEFAKCYQAAWWDDEQGGLSTAAKAALAATPASTDGFQAQPNGTRLATQQKAFFDGMQLAKQTAELGSPYLSARLAFCFCVDRGADSRLYTFLHDHVFTQAESFCLVITIFFGLTILAEIYLGCRSQEEHAAGAAEVLVQHGWQAGSGGSGSRVASKGRMIAP